MNKLEDTDLMPFGLYKDKELANVPADYLIYIYENFDLRHNKPLKAYIKDTLEILKTKIKE